MFRRIWWTKSYELICVMHWAIAKRACHNFFAHQNISVQSKCVKNKIDSISQQFTEPDFSLWRRLKMLICRKVLFSFAGEHNTLSQEIVTTSRTGKRKLCECSLLHNEKIDFDSQVFFDSIQLRSFGIIRCVCIGLDTGFPRNRSTLIN